MLILILAFFDKVRARSIVWPHVDSIDYKPSKNGEVKLAEVALTSREAVILLFIYFAFCDTKQLGLTPSHQQ